MYQRNLTMHALIFWAFGRKWQFIANSEKIFENFENCSSENCLKCIILAYFSKKLTNYALRFSPFGRKNHKRVGNFDKILKFFDENSIEKLNFFIFYFSFFFFFRKFVTKNRAFGNNTIFLQQNFQFRGGGDFPPFPPGYALGGNVPMFPHTGGAYAFMLKFYKGFMDNLESERSLSILWNETRTSTSFPSRASESRPQIFSFIYMYMA